MKEGKTSIVVCLAMLLSSAVACAGDFFEVKSLVAIKNISLHVSVDELGSLKQNGIKKDIEAKLLQSGITMSDDSAYVLNVTVDTMEHNSIKGLILMNVNLFFYQPVSLVRDGEIISASTWHASSLGYAGIQNIQNVRDQIKQMVDEFILDFSGANPKPN